MCMWVPPNGSQRERGLTSGYKQYTIGIVRTLHAANMKSVYSDTALNMTGHNRVSQPLPMDQPTTPQALPLVRMLRGKISAG
jgi:hypothetical protein